MPRAECAQVPIQTIEPIPHCCLRLLNLQAGLITDVESNSLIIALEPEAASYYCRSLPVNEFAVRGAKQPKFPAGTKYVLVDAGGVFERFS